MSTAITLTTINKPVVVNKFIRNIKKFNHKDIFFIVIGDNKTPSSVKDYLNTIAKKEKIEISYFDIKDQNIQDSKTKLQELSQQKLKKLPEYDLTKKEGPPHSPLFTVSLKVLNLRKIKANGNSIREAEKMLLK